MFSTSSSTALLCGLVVIVALFASALSQDPPFIMLYTSDHEGIAGSFTGFQQTWTSLDPFGSATPINDVAAARPFKLQGACGYSSSAVVASSNVTSNFSLWDPKQGSYWPGDPFSVTVPLHATIISVNTDPDLNEIFVVWDEADTGVTHFTAYSTLQWNQCDDYQVSGAVNAFYDAASHSFQMMYASGQSTIALSTVDGTQTTYALQVDFNMSTILQIVVDGSSENLAYVFTLVSNPGNASDIGVSTFSCSDDDKICEIGKPYFTLGIDVTQWYIEVAPQYDAENEELYVLLASADSSELRVYNTELGDFSRKYPVPDGQNAVWFNLCKPWPE